MNTRRSTPFLCALAALCLAVPTVAASKYDPLRLEPGLRPTVTDLEVRDERRGRTLPIRLYRPAGKEPAPVVLFSHGLGGSRMGSAYLGEHWSRRGYAVVYLQHPGSDESVWRGVPLAQRMAAMQRAASGANFLLRVKDVPAVLDQLEKWNREPGHALYGRLQMDRVGMSGHSFGAMTTQAVSGQSFPGGGPLYTDKRIKAAVMFSPSSPRVGSAATAFGSVRIPWMLMTGTLDVAPIGDQDLKSRLAVYPALPGGDKYELVLHNAEHSAFTERGMPRDRASRNPNHHRAILALSTAFWDAYLRNDAEALAWLRGEGARTVLEPKDTWQHK